ncbi:MAG: hypothetical protein QNJ72_20225 [Pleurocapsa sp. MO_226.B13]|nr:hypothetical protein [Pleurocapsa sp. MO_226.B13]
MFNEFRLIYCTQARAFLPFLLSRELNSASRRSRGMSGNFFAAQAIAFSSRRDTDRTKIDGSNSQLYLPFSIKIGL